MDLYSTMMNVLLQSVILMNIIFLDMGRTSSFLPILTLIENKPEIIVGCVLLGEDANTEEVPDWFINSTTAENPAAQLLDHVDEGRSNGFVLSNLDVFLVVKEPGSFLQFNVLAAVGCCNLNYSGTGGSGGRKVLELWLFRDQYAKANAFNGFTRISALWEVLKCS